MERPVCTILDEISRAFPHRRRAGDFALISGRPLGLEPWAIAAAFADKLDWTTLPGTFLDSHPTALSVLPTEASCFYLPAYLIADLCGEARRAAVVDVLLRGLGSDRATYDHSGTIADRMHGALPLQRWNRLSAEQVGAVTHWLEHRAADATEADRRRIVEALGSCWHLRLHDPKPASDRAAFIRDDQALEICGQPSADP